MEEIDNTAKFASASVNTLTADRMTFFLASLFGDREIVEEPVTGMKAVVSCYQGKYYLLKAEEGGEKNL